MYAKQPAITIITFVGLWLFFALMITFPVEGLEAALLGIHIWWEILFPALFPFFIIAELLVGFGIVHFVGTLLDPMMRPVFRVPGIGGFVVAMGFASGYPVGAKLTSTLWEQKQVTRIEGERLVAFTSTADPIFLAGAVSVGFFHDASLAAIIVFAHYGAGLVTGFLMRYHGRDERMIQKAEHSNHSMILKAFQEMHRARVEDGRPLSVLLKDAIESSLKLVFVIGGLVVFFSVFMELLTRSRLLNGFHWIATAILGLFHLPETLSQALVNGFFEVTLGVKAAGEAGASIPMVHKVAMAVLVISWAGLSVHAQIASLLSHTNLRYFPFVVARFLHGMIAVLFVYVFWDLFQSSASAWQQVIPTWEHAMQPAFPWTWYLRFSILVMIGVWMVFSFLFVTIQIFRWLRNIVL